MDIEFLLAPVTADVESALVEQIKEKVGADPLSPAIIITPPQATYATEQMLMDKLKVDGLIGIEVLSVARVAQRVLDEIRGIRGRTLSPAGKSMIIKNIIDEKAQEFELFGKFAAQAELPALFSSVISDLKSMNATPELLLDIAEKFSDDPITMQKFKDLSIVYGGYLTAAQSNDPPFIDAEDKLKYAADVIRRAKKEGDSALFLRDIHVFIYGFDVFNACITDFLTEVIKAAKSASFIFYHARPNQPVEPLYSLSDKSRADFQKAVGQERLRVKKIYGDANKPKEIFVLANNLFSFDAPAKVKSPAISLFVADNMRQEVDAVASQIAALREAGTDYKDIAVICGRPAQYLPLIKNRFAKVGIPCFIGEKRGIQQNNLAEFVLGAFKLSRGKVQKNTLIAHACTGYTALNNYEAAQLENYAYEHIMNASALFKTGFLEDNPHFKKFIEPVVELRKSAKKAKNGAEWIHCILDYMEKLDISKKVAEYAQNMRNSGAFQEADYIEQSYLKILSALKDASELCCAHAADSSVIQIIKSGFSSEQIACIPQGANEVLCAGYANAFIPEVKALFAIGANQESMPSYEEAPEILTESERQAIVLGDRAENGNANMTRQKFALIKALSRPSEKLFISYVDDGKEQPSVIIDKLQELFLDFPEKTINSRDIAPLLLQNAWELTAKRLRDAADGAPLSDDGLKYEAAVFNNAAYKDKYLKLAGALLRPNGNEAALKKDLAVQLYRNYKLSASSLEAQYRCPFKHFIQYGLRAHKQQEAEISPMSIGTFAHAIFNSVSGEIKKNGKTWRDYNSQDFSSILDKCVDNLKEGSSEYEAGTQNGAVLDAVILEVREAAKAIWRQYNSNSKGGSPLQLYGTEIEFKAENIGLSGIIDRIDKAQLNGRKYFGIVDYKTGRDKDFELYKAAAGLDLQLLIYALAAHDLLGEEYTLAGINYMMVKRLEKKLGYGEEPSSSESTNGYKMNGILTVPPKIAKALYGEDEDGQVYSVKMKVKADGESYYENSVKKYFSEENNEIADVLKFTRAIIAEAREKIDSGDIKMHPVSESAGKSECDNCDYRGVCRYDPATVEDVRLIQKQSKEEALNYIRGYLNEHGKKLNG